MTTTVMAALPSNSPTFRQLLSLPPSISLLSPSHYNRTLPGRSRKRVGSKDGKFVSDGSGKLRRPVKTMASLSGLLGGLFKSTDTGESTRQEYDSLVTVVNRLEDEMCGLSDMELRERTSLLKQRASKGDSLDSLLPVSLLINYSNSNSEENN